MDKGRALNEWRAWMLTKMNLLQIKETPKHNLRSSRQVTTRKLVIKMIKTMHEG